MEQGPDFWCWLDTIQFSYHCVHPIHAKMFSIQMLLHFSQIVQRVCTLVLFILSAFCLSVCLSGHAILAVRAIKSIMKDTIVVSVRFAAILKWRFL